MPELDTQSDHRRSPLASAWVTTPAMGAAPTLPQRRELLGALLRGRGLERILARRYLAKDPPADEDAALGAIAAATALDRHDRLVASHRFLSAHLACGASPRAIAAARLGGPERPERPALRSGLGPQSPAAVAVGVAFALRRATDAPVAVALSDRRWAAGEEHAAALQLAREQALRVVIVAIDVGRCDDPPMHGWVEADRDEFEAARAAVRIGIDAARAQSAPTLVALSCGPAEPAQRFAAPLSDGRILDRTDPLVAYERHLMINGFSRADLDAIRRDAADDLADELGAGLSTARRAA